MHTLGTHFQELDRNIRPPQERLDAASDLPTLVRDYLKACTDFPTLSPHTRLVGSYAQDLSVTDVKDVDFLVRVDGDPSTTDNPTPRSALASLRSALADLPKALAKKGYIDFDVTRARRSVHVEFVAEDFHLDVVPCIAPDGFDATLYVPDWGFKKWIASHPAGYVALLDTLNSRHDGKVKFLGRLFKHWRNVQMKTRRPKSYWLGALLVHHVRRDNGLDMSKAVAELFHDLLVAIYNQYASTLARDDEATPNIKDPMLDHNVSWNWGRPAFATFMHRLKDGIKWSGYALAGKEQDDAVYWWQQIFGEQYFPSDVTDAAKRQADLARPGRSSVSASGFVLPAGAAARISTHSQPTRFHGSHGKTVQ